MQTWPLLVVAVVLLPCVLSACPAAPPVAPCRSLQCFLPNATVHLGDFKGTVPGVQLDNVECGAFSLAAIASTLGTNNRSVTLVVSGVGASCTATLKLLGRSTAALIDVGGRSSLSISVQLLDGSAEDPLRLPAGVKLDTTTDMVITRLDVGVLHVPPWARSAIDDIVDRVASTTIVQLLAARLDAAVEALNTAARAPPPLDSPAPPVPPADPVTPLNETIVELAALASVRMQAVIGRALALLQNSSFAVASAPIVANASDTCVYVAPWRVAIDAASGLTATLETDAPLRLRAVLGGTRLAVRVLANVTVASAYGPALALSLAVSLDASAGSASSAWWLGLSRAWLGNMTYLSDVGAHPTCLAPVAALAGVSLTFRNALITPSLLGGDGSGSVDAELFALLNAVNAVFVAGYGAALPALVTGAAAALPGPLNDALAAARARAPPCPPAASQRPPPYELYDWPAMYPVDTLWLSVALAAGMAVAVALVLAAHFCLHRRGKDAAAAPGSAMAFASAVVLLCGATALTIVGVFSSLAWVMARVDAPHGATLATATLKQFTFTGLVRDSWTAGARFNAAALVVAGVVWPLARNTALTALLVFGRVRGCSPRLMAAAYALDYAGVLAAFVTTNAIFAKTAFNFVVPLMGAIDVHNFVSASGGIYLFLAACFASWFGGACAVWALRYQNADETKHHHHHHIASMRSVHTRQGWSAAMWALVCVLCAATLALSAWGLLVPALRLQLSGAAAVAVDALGRDPAPVLARVLSLWDVSVLLMSNQIDAWSLAGPTVGADVNWLLGFACVAAAPLAALLLVVAQHRAPRALLCCALLLRISSGAVIWALGVFTALLSTELLGRFIIGEKCNAIDALLRAYPTVFGASVTRCAVISASVEYGFYVVSAAAVASLLFCTMLISAALYDGQSTPPLWLRVTDRMRLTHCAAGKAGVRPAYELVVNDDGYRAPSATL